MLPTQGHKGQHNPGRWRRGSRLLEEIRSKWIWAQMNDSELNINQLKRQPLRQMCESTRERDARNEGSRQNWKESLLEGTIDPVPQLLVLSCRPIKGRAVGDKLSP